LPWSFSDSSWVTRSGSVGLWDQDPGKYLWPIRRAGQDPDMPPGCRTGRSNCREHGPESSSLIAKGKTPSGTLSNLRLTWGDVVISTTPVDLMGRLSNPPQTLECVADQGQRDTPPPGRTTSKGAKRSSNAPEPAI
jgi:hypothetical protein